MLVVISPAKALDMAPVAITPTQPQFHDDAVTLAALARDLTVADLRALMHISDDLAQLNRDRFAAFAAQPAADAVKPAALAFNGDTYQGLEARSLSADDLAWAQNHLGILSGLYGLLRPLDAIQPYRLEMGSKLHSPKGKSLYAYWGDRIAKALNAQAHALGSDVVVNCASQEYFGAVDLRALTPAVITPRFLEVKDGKPRIISFYAKRARGAMARFIIENRLTDAKAITGFTSGGYAYDPDYSTPDSPAFLRDAVVAA
jgi:uncharacterized protein